MFPRRKILAHVQALMNVQSFVQANCNNSHISYQLASWRSVRVRRYAL